MNALFWLTPERALACAVCFGKAPSEGGLVSGFLWGITILLAATFAIIAVLWAAVCKVERARESSEAVPS